ncbi:MAG: polysaccharide deacetylase family protein [Thalassotalea sp.]|nr:polysaccharide deacetylase family protein [Thalassotalea sp.]
MFNKILKRCPLLLFLLVFVGCQPLNNLSAPPKKTQNISHEFKDRLFIRSDNYLAGKAPIDTHEKRAYKYPKNYIIEGNKNTKKVALTFDDGPSIYTTKIIQKLNNYKIKATFFMVGNAIQSFPDLVKKIHNEGHLIANHSWDHTNANEHQYIDKYWQEQITSTNSLIKQLTGITPSLFRPPFGSTSEKIIEKLAENNINTIIWSIDTQDWNNNINTAQNIASIAIKHAHPESIILMHDGGGNRQGTVDALDEIIQYYQQLNYQFVTVDELIALH